MPGCAITFQVQLVLSFDSILEMYVCMVSFYP
jgi:hypothetical protein